MKKVFLLTGISFLFAMIYAQVPQGINYQGVARDVNGTILKNITLDVRLGIRQGSETGPVLWQEDHATSTNAAGLFTIILGDPGAVKSGGTLNGFDEIDWSSGSYVLETSLDIHDGNGFQSMGFSPILAVPYAYYAGTVGDLNQLKVKATGSVPPDSALFEVKRSDGQTVFAVYPEGVRVYVDTTSAKGPRGGFAIGGFGAAKGSGHELFRVTPDSVRIYLDPTGVKGPRGGFAIGGYGAVKGSTQEFLRVTPDSVRVYIDDRNLKGSRGGFAIGGFGAAKGKSPKYFNVSGRSSVEIINPSEPRVVWVPRKEAFLSGRVLIEHPDSVGQNSVAIGYESKAIGDWSAALGYQSIARGQNAMAMGSGAVAGRLNSFAFGNGAKALNIGSYAFGPGAEALGVGSVALGGKGIDQSGNQTANVTQAIGDYSFAFGLGANSSGLGSIAMGTANTSSGQFSLALGFSTSATGFCATALGFNTIASGSRSLAIGSQSSAQGFGSVAMGELAQAQNYYSFAMGHSAIAAGKGSFAFGESTLAQGDYSFALGANSQSLGYQSVAFGGQAIGDYSLAMGVGSVAHSFGALVLGQFNADGLQDGAPPISKSIWQDTDPVLVVGNGTGGTPNNALILYKNGDLHISGTFTQVSDARLKKNITPLAATLDKIGKIKPVTFEFKDTRMHPAGVHIGFLAQDIEPLFPELVKKDSRGYLSVDYPAMTAVLLRSLQEQQQIILRLQREVSALKSEREEIALLRNELEHLKAQMEYASMKE